MLIRVFTLSFEPVTGRFNDDPVRDFIADKEVATISDHFFVKDEAPYLVLVVRYRLAGPVAAPPVAAPAGARQRDESWRTTLDAADWPLFNTLRDWRGEQARSAGIPSYVICNNRELAAVISKRPTTLAELGQIDGFGDAKLKKYAICDVLEPVFERRAIFDSDACRKGKGTHAAIARAQQFARRYRFFAKCDVRRFFASVDHAALRTLLRRLFKDAALLALLDRIIEQAPPDAAPGRGLPIGNLTSQHFANLYLGELDHHLKERQRVPGYLRYMDDMLLFADDKASLQRWLAELRGFLAERLGLVLKEEVTLVAPVTEGIPFLGFRVYPGLIRLNQRTRRRFLRQVQNLEQAHGVGRLATQDLCQRAASLFAHVAQADSYRLRRRVTRASIVDG